MRAAISPEAPRVAGVLPWCRDLARPIWRCHARSHASLRDYIKPERPRCQGRGALLHRRSARPALSLFGAISRGSRPPKLSAAGGAAMTLLLLLAGLGGIMLLGEQFEAHRLRAFIFNFEVARHRGSADV
jgi:hypothetical protein